MKQGLDEKRVVRLLGIILYLFGALLLLLTKIFEWVAALGDQAVEMGLARYSNFTGRIAASSFAEDKELLKLLHNVQNSILPLANVLLPCFFIFGIFCMLIAIVWIAAPHSVAQFFVDFRILKRTSGQMSIEIASELDNEQHFEKKLKQERKESILRKIILFPAGGVLILVLTISIFHCATDKSSEIRDLNEELTQKVATYIQAQKKYFRKTEKIASTKKIDYDLSESDFFKYHSKSTGVWTADLKESMARCPEGSRWSIYISTSGFFSKKLHIARIAPKNSHCADLIPNFKQIGKEQKVKKKK